MEVEEKGLKLSITGGGKEGQRKAITSCQHVEEKFQECSKEEGVVLETSVETLGVDLRTRTQQEVSYEILAHQKFYMRTGVRKLLRTGLVPSRVWRGQAVGIAPTEVEIEEACGSSSRQEGCGVALTLHGSE